jgi:hypothetical protein
MHGRCWPRARHASIALTSLALAFARADAFTVTADFGALGDFGGYSGAPANCDVDVATPSGNFVQFTAGAGVGHLGGTSDLDIDSGEEMEFHLYTDRAAVSYQVTAAGNADADGLVGEGYVEAFDAVGSLGVVPVSGVGYHDVAALFGGTAIRRFDLTSIESVRIRRLRYELRAGDEATAVFQPLFPINSATVSQCGVTLSSEDGDVEQIYGGGAGVIGGASNRIDAGEVLTVDFGGEALVDVSYSVADSTDVGGSGEPGDHFVEAFDANGTSLGLRAGFDSDDPIALSEAFGGAPIARFDLIGVNDSFRLAYLQFAPEPAALATGAAAVVALRALRRRRYSRRRGVNGDTP